MEVESLLKIFEEEKIFLNKHKQTEFMTEEVKIRSEFCSYERERAAVECLQSS